MQAYAIESNKVIEQFSTNPETGLGEGEIERRLKEFGHNTLPQAKSKSLGFIFLIQFKNPLIYLLLIATMVCMFLDEYTDAFFIGIVLLLNASIGAWQEWKAERSASSLQSIIKIRTRVIRSGKESVIDAVDLVPGDIVLLESGNRVPADIRIITSKELNVDESLLTGESVAVEKNEKPVSPEASVGDRSSMLFAASTVFSGRVKGVVTATGEHTEVGKIAYTLKHAVSLKPPLVIRIERLSRQIAYIVLAAIVLIAVISLMQGASFEEIFFLSVTLAVSAIPEGLPVAITVALSVATSRMAKRNVIVRKLSAVEGLGSSTFIASDKTGTLTVNMQTVKILAEPGNNDWEIEGQGYNNDGEIRSTHSEGNRKWLNEILKLVSICNEAELVHKNESWQHLGDAVDVALLAVAMKGGVNPQELRSSTKILAELPFESERKYAAVFYREGNEVIVAIKGALETILPICIYHENSAGSFPIDSALINIKADELTSSGYRVLGVAKGKIPLENFDSNKLESYLMKLTFMGLTGLIDPLREDVKDSIKLCHDAGITVAIVTGDHPLTALAIAKELQIADDLKAVITGKELAALSEEDFKEIVADKKVFARVSPLQKMQITQALSEKGHFIAVTGDGVNDVPALKKANIGVAMGGGTDLAKDTADIIVTDDNFSSIQAGVEEGRFAYDNIRKVTYLLISTGAAEIMLFLASLITGLPMPLTAVQLLWLNLVTNGIQDVALAFEGGEPGAMKRKPKNPKEGIFNRKMIEQTLLSGFVMGGLAFSLWYILLEDNFSELHARTMVLMLMVLLENIHAFNCRSEYSSVFKVPLSRNWYIVLGVLAAQLIHQIAIQIPFMQTVLQTDNVSLAEWGKLLATSLVLLAVMELYKLISKNRGS
ncbi:MAG: cation-translocating P-type ATPase [Flavobacteriales bacterium]